MKTLQECKETVAKEYGYQSWEALRFSHSMTFGLWETYIDKATELYAQSRTEELQKEIERLKAERQWISVSERLPENTDNVLCAMLNFNDTKFIQFVGSYTKGHEIEYDDDDYDGDYDEVEDRNGTLYLKPGWYELEETPSGPYDTQWVKREVTHWQPMPEPPVIVCGLKKT